MQTITLITGNKHKLEEWQRLVPADRYVLEHHAIDLDELQSLDSREIVRHKIRQAYELLKKPVIVEDVSAGLDKLSGLPGPFIKFFNERLGNDSLLQLGGEGAGMTATCTIGYFDGEHEIMVDGTLHGTVTSPHDRPPLLHETFGFDFVFMPDGATKTYAEMTGAEKDALSHRSLAVNKLLAELARL